MHKHKMPAAYVDTKEPDENGLAAAGAGGQTGTDKETEKQDVSLLHFLLS